MFALIYIYGMKEINPDNFRISYKFFVYYIIGNNRAWGNSSLNYIYWNEFDEPWVNQTQKMSYSKFSNSWCTFKNIS